MTSTRRVLRTARAALRPALIASLFLLVGGRPACAQEYPKWEVFGGFSYARVNLGPQAQIFVPTTQNYWGMEINGSFNPRPYLRVLVCDFAAELGGSKTSTPFFHTDVRTSQVLFGPEFVLRSDKLAPFAHALIGITNTRLVETIGGSDVVPDVARRTNLALGVGGGLDIPWTRLITVRAFQADYIPTRLSGTWENHFRLSTGLVFSFGYPRRSRTALRR